jgi:hypothetical protein
MKYIHDNIGYQQHLDHDDSTEREPAGTLMKYSMYVLAGVWCCVCGVCVVQCGGGVVFFFGCGAAFFLCSIDPSKVN